MATILLVEDERSLLTTIAYNLRHEGYDLLTAQDGEAALQSVVQNPDLVLLDVMLPKVDGFEVCRRLRQRSAVPILMLTAKDMRWTGWWGSSWARTTTSRSPSVCGSCWPG